MAGKTEILGLGELRQQFARLRDVDRGARRSVVAGGQALKRKARSIALAKGLRKSGALLANIVIKRERAAPAGTSEYHLGVRHGRGLTSKAKKDRRLAVNQAGRVVTRYNNDPFYWRFLEFGTRHISRRPFLEPALDEGHNEALDAMQKAMAREIDRQGKA